MTRGAIASPLSVRLRSIVRVFASFPKLGTLRKMLHSCTQLPYLRYLTLLRGAKVSVCLRWPLPGFPHSPFGSASANHNVRGLAAIGLWTP